MSLRKELQDGMHHAIGARICEFGFVARISQQDFVRKSDSGILNFHLNFAGYVGAIDVLPSVAVRQDKLEELRHDFENRLSKAERRETYTIGSGIGVLHDGRTKIWEVDSADEIDTAADEMMEMFVSAGMPFLIKYSDPHNLLDAVSVDGKEAGWGLGSIFDRAMDAIGLAYLLGERERFHDLIETKQADLEKGDARERQQFNEYVEYLSNKMNLEMGAEPGG